MARIGTGNNFIGGTATFASAAFATWSFHLFAKGGAVPGTSRFSYGLSVRNNGGAGSMPDFGFEWDHTSAAFTQCILNRRASTAYDVAKFTTSLAANTWYGVGGTMDGATLRTYLNGLAETTVASASPSSSAAFANMLVQQSNTSANPWPDGNVAEVALWSNTVLTADQMLALGKGFSPATVEPHGLVMYAPLVRGTKELIAAALADSGTPVWVDHPRVFA